MIELVNNYLVFEVRFIDLEYIYKLAANEYQIPMSTYSQAQ